MGYFFNAKFSAGKKMPKQKKLEFFFENPSIERSGKYFCP
jgi:hypothetical protein